MPSSWSYDVEVPKRDGSHCEVLWRNVNNGCLSAGQKNYHVLVRVVFIKGRNEDLERLRVELNWELGGKIGFGHVVLEKVVFKENPEERLEEGDIHKGLKELRVQAAWERACQERGAVIRLPGSCECACNAKGSLGIG